jgi:tRNA modification GTPase
MGWPYTGGTERALVTPIAGTTRDTIDAVFTLHDGAHVTIVDTAGLRTDAQDIVENMGVA